MAEKTAALGFTMYWGFTPAINFFNNSPIAPSADEEINVLLSQTGGDGRHLFKSLCDILPLDGRSKPINIYVHENFKENIARIILFLTLFCETGMAARERMEIYLDLFGNTLVRDKTAAWLKSVVPELIQLVTEDDKCESVLKGLINWETLKFKERDELEEIFSSWLPNHKFDIEQLRD